MIESAGVPATALAGIPEIVVVWVAVSGPPVTLPPWPLCCVAGATTVTSSSSVCSARATASIPSEPTPSSFVTSTRSWRVSGSVVVVVAAAVVVGAAVLVVGAAVVVGGAVVPAAVVVGAAVVATAVVAATTVVAELLSSPPQAASRERRRADTDDPHELTESSLHGPNHR